MALVSFNAYHSYLEAMRGLNNAERGRLFTACLTYSMTGEEPELCGNERFVFPGMKWQMDRDREKYEAKCAANRLNGALGGQANAAERKRTPPDALQTPPKEKEKEKEKDKDNAGELLRPGRFTPPTAQEVRAYCATPSPRRTSPALWPSGQASPCRA